MHPDTVANLKGRLTNRSSGFHSGTTLAQPNERPETMAKEVKQFRKQAERAERLANSATDAEVSKNYASLAEAYRAQADILKKKKKKMKKEALRRSKSDKKAARSG